MPYLTTITLDNGVKLKIHRCRGAKNIGFSLLTRYGSTFEPKDKRGLTHLLEHMLFKSNSKYTAREMNRIIEFAGGDWNGSTYWDSMTIYFDVLSKGLLKVLDVLDSVIMNRSFDPVEFKNEKYVVLTELENNFNDPVARIYQLGLRALFGDSDLGSPISGYRETVESITLEDLIELKERIFRGNDMIAVTLGDVTDEHIQYIKDILSKIQPGSIKKKKPTRSKPTHIVEEMDTGEQCYLSVSWNVNREELFEVIMLENILSAGTYNILFEELREKRGIGYSFGVVHDFVMDTGYINVVVEGYECKKREEAKVTLLEILDKIKENNIPKDLTEGKKNYLRFIKEKFRSFYGDRAEDTARRIHHGYDLESMELVDRLVEMKWSGFEKIIRKPAIAEIIPNNKK